MGEAYKSVYIGNVIVFKDFLFNSIKITSLITMMG